MKPMTTRDRFHAVMRFEPFDRLPIVEWAAWWHQTINRWHREKLPSSVTHPHAIAAHFGLELYKQAWISPRRPSCPAEPVHGAGIIANMDDYERIRPHLYPDVDVAAVFPWREWFTQQQRGETVVWFTVEGFFWFARSLLGIERHMLAFYDQPDLIHRINRDLADWHQRVFDTITQWGIPDFMTFAEDMSYNNGPMLSEDMFDEFMLPYYRQLTPFLACRGIWSIVDSDGDISMPCHWFDRAGLNGVLPLERQAGVDIARLRRDHPRMRFIGHFDKLTMHRGESVMRAEFERLLPVAARGGFIISCDHQTPPAVSYDDYRLYLDLFREYAVKAGDMSQR